MENIPDTRTDIQDSSSFTEDQIMEFLKEVKDPEIPVLSVVALGIISNVRFENDKWMIEMTPTFAGCPAIGVMKTGIIDVLKGKGIENVEVQVMYKRPWSSNQITPEGKDALKKFGLSPPPAFDGNLTLEVLMEAVCPVCGSKNTTLLNPFGPTACRAVHHCEDCKETFEQFKPL